MQSCHGVVSACALLVNDELWGFYSPRSVHQDDVRDAAARLQPYYAVPSGYMSLDMLPLTG